MKEEEEERKVVRSVGRSFFRSSNSCELLIVCIG